MDLSGKKVLVVGLARSGMAAIRVLKKLGAEVTLSESKKKDDIKEIGFLNENNVEIVGQDMAVFERDFDFVVKNPGVPYRSPMMQKLQERNIPVITEIELAYQVAKPQHYIAITGTNGKTTTSTLTYEILRRAFPGKAHLCGNIGIPAMMKPYRYVHRHYRTICRYADRQSKRHSAKKFSHFINLVIIIYFTQDMSAYQKHCQRDYCNYNR